MITNTTMVQHFADWVAPFPRIQHSLPLSLKFLYTTPSPGALRARELRAIIIRGLRRVPIMPRDALSDSGCKYFQLAIAQARSASEKSGRYGRGWSRAGEEVGRGGEEV